MRPHTISYGKFNYSGGKTSKTSCYLQPSSLNFISLYVSTPADQESARSKFLTTCYTELHCKTYEKLLYYHIP